MSDEQYAIQRLEQATGGIRLRGSRPGEPMALAPEPLEMPMDEETDDRAAA